MDDRTSQVRKRAHAIWLEEGEPEGREADHWQRAEQEIADAAAAPEPSSQPASEPQPEPAKPRKKPARAPKRP